MYENGKTYSPHSGKYTHVLCMICRNGEWFIPNRQIGGASTSRIANMYIYICTFVYLILQEIQTSNIEKPWWPRDMTGGFPPAIGRSSETEINSHHGQCHAHSASVCAPPRATVASTHHQLRSHQSNFIYSTKFVWSSRWFLGFLIFLLLRFSPGVLCQI